MAVKKRTEAEEAERLADIRRLFSAYRAVFGRDGARTVAQELVWSHLRVLAYKDRTTMLPDANGALCPLRTAQAEGQRVLFLQIEEFIRKASEADDKPATPDVKR
jgi:hypothetical protein